jgi:hypothetical protein
VAERRTQLVGQITGDGLEVVPERNDVKPATVVFVVFQFAIATVFPLSWLAEDGGPIDSPLLREHSWKMLLCAQALSSAAGVWEGFTGRGGRQRLLACAAAPVA